MLPDTQSDAHCDADAEHYSLGFYNGNVITLSNTNTEPKQLRVHDSDCKFDFFWEHYPNAHFNTSAFRHADTDVLRIDDIDADSYDNPLLDTDAHNDAVADSIADAYFGDAIWISTAAGYR